MGLLEEGDPKVKLGCPFFIPSRKAPHFLLKIHLKTFPSRKSCLFLLKFYNQTILSRIKPQILPKIHFLPISGTKISIFPLIFMEWLPFFHFGYPQPSIHRQGLKNILRGVGNHFRWTINFRVFEQMPLRRQTGHL